VTLFVAWQLFGTVEKAQTLKTPSFVLKTQGPQAQKIVVPAQAFYYSPVLPLPPIKDIARRDNIVAPLMDMTTPMVGFGVCLTLLLLCSLVWLWLKDRLPWFPYRAGPMTQLLRQLNAQEHTLSEQQLRAIHSALNQSAGASLYPDNLATLFDHAPYFASERGQIEQFFQQSWDIFYTDQSSGHRPIAAAPTIQWIKQIALAERLLRRTQ
jgi:hypothetical protein